MSSVWYDFSVFKKGQVRLANQQPYSGLTTAEVQERIARGQSNDYKPDIGRSYWDIVRDNVLNVFNLILFPLLAVIIAFEQYAVAFFAGFSVVSNALFGTIQEVMAKRQLNKLISQAEKSVKVYRNGQLEEVPERQIVVDDILPLEPGDRIPVDGIVLQSDALEVDESQLTGESDSILKDVETDVHSGSFCIAGTGVMKATRVGRESTINRISTVATKYKRNLTPTQERIEALVQIAILIMAIFAPMLWFADYLKEDPLLERVKNAVVFITSIVPYGLVLIVIISLSIGAISITRHQTLIRKVNAVESLANVTVLCFDKTGTITQNKLAVVEIIPVHGAEVPDITRLLRAYTDNLGHLNGTAAAVQHFVEDQPAQTQTKLQEIPFNSARKWGAVVLPEETLILGAPERILNPEDSADLQILRRAERLSAEGLRVLAFARGTSAPENGQLGPDVQPLGLVTLSDQIREDITETLESFRQQNVALKVISGDNLETVKAIAQQAGITIDTAYTGDALKAMNEAEFEGAVAQGNVFARIEPDTKRHIVQVLKKQGHHVAMVGDGVNDVPSLKEAHLSIVMNDGAQITKEIGDIILLNNAMSTLPKAFTEGTEITQTIFGTVKLFLAKAFYNLMLFIFVGFMGLPFPITPIQINWIGFGTVNIVATLVAIKIMRPAYMENFRRDVLDYVITLALTSSVAMSFLFATIYVWTDYNTDAARSVVALYASMTGVIIFYNTFGIQLDGFTTLRKHPVVAGVGLFMTFFTLLGFYAAPGLLEFVAPTNEQVYLITGVLLLNIIVLNWSMKRRGVINNLWTLFAP